MLIQDIHQPFGLHSISVDGILNPRFFYGLFPGFFRGNSWGPLKKMVPVKLAAKIGTISKKQVSSAEHSGRNVQSLHQWRGHCPFATSASFGTLPGLDIPWGKTSLPCRIGRTNTARLSQTRKPARVWPGQNNPTWPGSWSSDWLH